MANIVEISGLSKEYKTGFLRKRTVRALNRLDLGVREGQIFGFLGGNGAGKTTTIKILMGLLYPTSGSARIFDKNISDIRMHDRIGYCPENPYFYDYLTARELMDYFGELFRIERELRRRRAEELLEMVGLRNDDRSKQLRKFSKGMLQRVALAQSLLNDPQLVFLDEPMSGLDPVGRREVRELIIGLREKGKTVFMSTHILSDVETLCDDVAILRGGELAASGDLRNLLSEELESEGFEVSFNGITASELDSKCRSLSGASFHSGGTNSATARVSNESGVRELLGTIAGTDATLISVQPVRRSLEELFVRKTED